MVLARAIDIMSAGAPASIQERKLREKSEMMVASSVQLTAGKEGVL